jgi:cell division protein FtsL
MSTRRRTHERTSWIAGATEALTASGAVASPARARTGRRKRSGRVRRPSLLRRVVTRANTNVRFRRLLIGLFTTVVVVTAVACSVFVIMLNNIVIERSAELGELDHKRRELRTENAQIAADIARLSAPPRVRRLAVKRLKMQAAPRMARFIYLDPGNQPMTAARRRLLERRAARRERRRKRAAAAATTTKTDAANADTATRAQASSPTSAAVT